MSTRAVALGIVFIVGTALRVPQVARPIDRADNLWREADLATIARNFNHEGANILYPRIDWRGDGPGYVEMEFPAYPWAIAWLQQRFGISEVLGGRLLALAFSLAALAIFGALASSCLSDVGMVAAATFFALNPLAVEASTLLLADGLMLLFYLAAVYAFLRWIDTESWSAYACAAGATTCAILAKSPAVHVGLLLAWWALRKFGRRALALPSLWAFAAVALVGPILWYRHAYGLWATYGNSLGVSNEHHWIGWDIFTNPRLVGGIVKRELMNVWTPPSVLAVALGVCLSPSRRAVFIAWSWLVVIAIYYLVTVRTTSGIWGVYYHLVSVPPVALLVGTGAEGIAGLWTRRTGAGPEGRTV